MNKPIYTEKDLPKADLEKIGIATGGQLLLEQKDIDALLAGRRTDLVRLGNLQLDGVNIPGIDTKLSVRPNADGELKLLFHPIYKEVQLPHILTLKEAEELETGEIVNLLKTVPGEEGMDKEVLVEFDKETKEFIITDIGRITQPFKVNNELMTPEQLRLYRKGEAVGLEDGTRFQYSGTEANGVRSNRLVLIASLLIDGGLTYIVYSCLKAIIGEKHDPGFAEQLSEGYKAAVAERNYTNQPFNQIDQPDRYIQPEQAHSKKGTTR